MGKWNTERWTMDDETLESLDYEGLLRECYRRQWKASIKVVYELWSDILTKSDMDQAAKITLFELKMSGKSNEEALKMFVRAFKRRLIKEWRDSLPVHLPDHVFNATKPDDVSYATDDNIDVTVGYSWNELSALLTAQYNRSFSEVGAMFDSDEVGGDFGAVDSLVNHYIHGDLVEDGAKELVEFAMSGLCNMDYAIIRLYYLEGDEDTTDAEVAERLGEESLDLFGAEQRFTPWYVWKHRTDALKYMRGVLNVTPNE